MAFILPLSNIYLSYYTVKVVKLRMIFTYFCSQICRNQIQEKEKNHFSSMAKWFRPYQNLFNLVSVKMANLKSGKTPKQALENINDLCHPVKEQHDPHNNHNITANFHDFDTMLLNPFHPTNEE